MKLANPLKPSRRTFLAGMAATGVTVMVPESVLAADLDPRVNAILAKYPTTDMHSHANVNMVTEGESDPAMDPPWDVAAAMKKSGFSALCHAYHLDVLIALDKKPETPSTYYNAHIQALNQMDRILTRNNIKRVFNLKQVQDAHKKGELVIVQAIEGAQFIQGKLERVEEAYRRGMRHLQLMHSKHDFTAPLGEIQSGAQTVKGLTPMGKEVVKECNRLHMVMDLAHGAFPTVKQVIDVTTQPFVVSHTKLKPATGGNARMVTPEYAKAVAASGGVIGIWHLVDTVKDYVVAIKEMVDVIGTDHVGIGMDQYLIGRQGTGGAISVWPGQDGVGLMYYVANEMLMQGFTPEEVGKIAGGNYFRVFDKVIGNRA